MGAYEEMLARKEVRARPCGFEPGEMPAALFGWQRVVVERACRAGRYAIFADCGLGKTLMQLEWARQVCRETGGAVLVVAPLAVAAQTVAEGEKFGIPAAQAREMPDGPSGIVVTNYEMLDRFDMTAFAGVVLDESSILKSFTGKTKRRLTEACREVPYRLSCTATPSPNDLMELLNQSEFLGVMRSGEALSVWFVNDQSEAGRYRLKGHAVASFWAWVATWATALSRPSDLGFPDDGFELPPLTERDVVVETDQRGDEGEPTLFHVPSLSATSFHREKRRSLEARCEAAAAVARNYADLAHEQVVVWCYLNDESSLLARLIPGAVEVRGGDSPEEKERAARGFQAGEFRVLVSKPSIFGFGLNFQQCSHEVFCGLDYSFESYYQAVRRVYRYGQRNPVEVVRVVGRDELRILDAIGHKADMHAAERDSIARAVAGGESAFRLSAPGAPIPEIPFLKEAC